MKMRTLRLEPRGPAGATASRNAASDSTAWSTVTKFTLGSGVPSGHSMFPDVWPGGIATLRRETAAQEQPRVGRDERLAPIAPFFIGGILFRVGFGRFKATYHSKARSWHRDTVRQAQ